MDAQRRTLGEEISDTSDQADTVARFLSGLGYRRHPEHGGAETVPSTFSRWHIAVTGSTNTDLVNASRYGPDDGIVLTTDHQSKGKGRQNRSWLDQPGSALLSSVRWSVAVHELPMVPLAVGLAVAEAVQGLVDDLGVDSGIESEPAVVLKWPNDVLVPALQNQKLAGILAESAPVPGTEGQRQGVVIGMGMNINWLGQPPPEVADRVATLTATLARYGIDQQPTVDEVLMCYLKALAIRLDDLDPNSILAAYRLRCDTVGRKVQFETADGVIDGIAVDVDDTGALVVSESTGGVHRLHAGDAHHR